VKLTHLQRSGSEVQVTWDYTSTPQSDFVAWCLMKPLTPELNPSTQRCLTRFFAGDFAS
jgi:hypothetical protein